LFFTVIEAYYHDIMPLKLSRPLIKIKLESIFQKPEKKFFLQMKFTMQMLL